MITCRATQTSQSSHPVTPLPAPAADTSPTGECSDQGLTAPLLPSALAALFIVGDYAAEGQLGVMPAPSGSLMVPTACWISNSVIAVEAPHCGPKIPAHMVFPCHLGLIHAMASATVPVS